MPPSNSRYDAWLCRILQADGTELFRFASAPAGQGSPTPVAECLGTNMEEDEVRRLADEIRRNVPGVEVEPPPAT